MVTKSVVPLSSGTVRYRSVCRREAPSMCAASIDLPRQALQTREVEEHEVPGLFPDADDHERGERELRIAEPVLAADADQSKEDVHEAVAGREHEQPDRRGADHRQDRRMEERESVQPDGPERTVELEREEEREEDAHRHGDDGVDHRVADHLPESRVLEQRHVVARARERRDLYRLVLDEETVVDDPHGRPERECGDE